MIFQLSEKARQFATILLGDCLASLQTLPDGSIDCCVTSPPYWGLRDYGADGQLGLEKTPEEYVANMVAVFREVRRVLRDDGTCWVNLGDSYASGGGQASPHRDSCGGIGKKGTRGTQPYHSAGGGFERPASIAGAIKPKDLVGIPWRVAFALQADGWYLRQDIIWHKPNPMPESVRDRCTKAHEYIFLLAKAPRYYFDSDSIREPMATDGKGGLWGANRGPKATWAHDETHKAAHGKPLWRGERSVNPIGRNRRSVWKVTTRPYKGAHFAVYPPELIRPCIKAGCRPGGTVLDPFGGSGTTAQVAIEEGRKAIICELNPDYAALAEQRISAALS